MGFLLLVYLLVEVGVFMAVSSWTGALWAIALLLAGALVGSWLTRRQGMKAVRAVVDAARSGRSGHEEITDGMLVAVGGLLLVLPGFVTDVMGILLMLPPTRGVLGRAWLRKLQRTAHAHQRSRRIVIVEGEVIDDEMDLATGEPPHRHVTPRVIEGPQ